MQTTRQHILYWQFSLILVTIEIAIDKKGKKRLTDHVARTDFQLFTFAFYHPSFVWSSKLASFASFEVLSEFPCFHAVEPSPSICEPSRFAQGASPRHAHAAHLA